MIRPIKKNFFEHFRLKEIAPPTSDKELQDLVGASFDSEQHRAALSLVLAIMIEKVSQSHPGIALVMGIGFSDKELNISVNNIAWLTKTFLDQVTKKTAKEEYIKILNNAIDELLILTSVNSEIIKLLTAFNALHRQDSEMNDLQKFLEEVQNSKPI